MVEVTEEFEHIRSVIAGHFEWLLVREKGLSFPLDQTEIAIERVRGKIMLGITDDQGFRSWRINSFVSRDGDIEFEVAGRFGKGTERIRLIPRTSAKQLGMEIEIARLKRANEVADALCSALGTAKLVRVSIPKANGRIAHIFFKDPSGALHALMTDVARTMVPESLLAAALLWQLKLDLRKKNRVEMIWIAAETRTARGLQKLLALLKSPVGNTITIAELKENAGETSFVPLSARTISGLWRERSAKLTLPQTPTISVTARRIIDLAPDKIDIVLSQQGETLRFAGLPFARLRRLMERERTWFGVNKVRHPLSTGSWEMLSQLVDDLGEYRRFDAPNPHHNFYRAAPEAWLESILRRNIKLLDSNLILSPIYTQFRAFNDKIDLLALRKDGRLVIIELKTSPDREMVLQAADYWRNIELRRRQGKLAEANLFDGREIADRPAIIYIAAPAWSFHRDFEFYARMLSKEVELWRFELHENWREKIKVIARRTYSDAGL